MLLDSMFMKQLNRIGKNYKNLERVYAENCFSNVLKFWLYLIENETGNCRQCIVGMICSRKAAQDSQAMIQTQEQSLTLQQNFVKWDYCKM